MSNYSSPFTTRSGWWVFILPFLWSYVTFTIVASYCDVVVISKYYKWGSTEAMLRVAGSLLIAQGLFTYDVRKASRLLDPSPSMLINATSCIEFRFT